MTKSRPNFLLLAALFLLLLGNYVFASPVDTISSRSWEFVKNMGQFNDKVKFNVQTNSGGIFLENDGYTVVQYDPKKLHEISEMKHNGGKYNIGTIGAYAYKVVLKNCNTDAYSFGTSEFSHKYNFFKSNEQKHWASDVPAYKEILYQNVYPDINIRFASEEGYFKYEFHVMPGGDVNDVVLKYEGLRGISKMGEALYLSTDFDRVAELKPFVYQIDEKGDTVTIECSYRLQNNELKFDVAEYDRSMILVIDPTVVFSSFTGSTADNWGYTATYDKDGNLYGGGIAFGVGYPTSVGAYQVDYNGVVDVAISKFSADGSTLLYSTYLGGSAADIPHSMYVNHNNELYVFGTTSSTDFPVTAGSFCTSFNGGDSVRLSTNIDFANGSDIFVSKFSASGSQLLASTFVGGSGNDGLNTAAVLRKNYADDNRGEIIVDANSNAYIVTSTQSSDFPVTADAFQTAYGGGQDACVFKMSQDLSSMIWSSYYGGEADDAGYSMFVSKDGSIYICGSTLSNGLSVPANAYQPVHADSGGNVDGYVAHISWNGNFLLHSTYLGKVGYDQAYLIEGNSDNIPYIFGQTEAEGEAWVYNAAYYVPSGGQFLVKFNSDLQTPVWSTAFGSGNGGPDISPTALMADYCSNIYLSGWGSYNLNHFGGTNGLPVTPDAFQSSTDGSDFYFMSLHDDASYLVYASFYGGAAGSAREHVDGGTSRFDKKGCIYQAVCAGCGGQSSFPTTAGAYSNINGSTNCNLGVVKINFKIPAVVADFDCPNTVCLPDTAVFTNNTQTYSPNSNVFWNFGDGYTSTLWNPKHYYAASGTYIVTLIVHDAQSCNIADTIERQIFVMSNSVNSLQTLNTCDGDFVELGIPPSPDVTYAWAPETSLNSSTISNPIATPDASTTYMLIVTSDYGCTDTLYQDVIVHTLDIDIPAFGHDTTICKGDTITLGIAPVTTDNYSIAWSTDQGFQNIIASDVLSIEVSPETTSAYYVKIETDYCAKTISFQIVVSDLEINLPERFVSCFGNEVELSVSYTGGVSPLTYLWQVEGVGSSTEANAVFNVPHTTPFDLVVTDVVGCSVTAHGNIIVQEGTFNDGVAAWCVPSEVIAYHSTTLFSTEYDDSYTWQWQPAQDLANPNSQSTSAFLIEETIYTVVVTDTFGCSLSDTVIVKVKPVTCEMPYVFVPNSFTPNGDGNNDILFVRSDIIEEMLFVVYNRWGEKVFESARLTDGWDGKYRGKECPRGVYDYHLTGKCIDGDDLNVKGNVTLFR